MKKSSKIIIILILVLIAIGIIAFLFISQYIRLGNSNSIIASQNIIDPDRIVYRNKEGKYYVFTKDTTSYSLVKDAIYNSVINYNESGDTLSDTDIDNVHNASFVELDYKTASKNYLLPLENNKSKNLIKLGTSGGNIVSTNLRNLNKVINILNSNSKDQPSYEFNYKELLSTNVLNTIEYKYLQEFKSINYKIYQVKITNLDDYELYKQMCNLAFDYEITEDTFKDNDLILTVSMLPKIAVKVNIGNIKYTYSNVENSSTMSYHCHLLIVSKLVNTDCIYNTDLAEIDQKVEYDNFQTEYNNSVSNLDSSIFVTDFTEFSEQYKNSNSTITKEEASKTADIAFEEAQRIAGSYDKSTQTCQELEINPNNFFTRRTSEGDSTQPNKVSVYAFSRTDDLGNGIEVYIDKRLGKIVGGRAFGD